MGKGQKTLSVPKELWDKLETVLEQQREILELWNVYQVSDLFKYCCRLGLKDLQQIILEFHKAHKTIEENIPKR